MGNTIRVGVDPGFPRCHQLTPSLGISSLTRAECAYPQDILPYGRRFQIRQRSEPKHSETAVGNMQHFRGQDLESKLAWMMSGDNSTSLSVPHDKFSIHAYINHLCRMLFPGGRPTSLAHSSLVGGTKRNASLVFFRNKWIKSY